MRTSLKWTLGLLAVAGLAGAGIVSAHGGGLGGYFGGSAGPRGPGGNATAERVECPDDITVGECRALHGDPCNDGMTVGECKAALEAQREEAKAAFIADCTERTGNETRCQQLAEHPPRHGPGGPGGPGGRDGRGPRGPPPPPGERPDDAPEGEPDDGQGA